MRFLSVNSDSFLIELASLQETLALYSKLQNLHLKGIKDLIPAAKTILVFFDEINSDFKTLSTLIGRLDIDLDVQQHSQQVIIPIRYDGEDLAQVAELQGLSVADLIRKHHQSTWDVAFIGFAPGFAYMNSPDQPFTDIPRLKTPRKKIPAGSLGLAGQYSGIYPKDSPGGWQLIGTTTEKMWDLERSNPALLRPGIRVHFEDVTHHPVSINVPKQIIAVEDTGSKQPLFKIISSGLQTTIQDEGRFQQTNIGVGTAGAMDIDSMHSANRIVGNPSETPIIEVLNGGLKVKMQHSAVIAVTGAISNIHVKFADGQKADFECYQPIALECDDEFHIQTPHAGLRNYLSVRGGFDIQPILNSCSFDSLAILGPSPLTVGDVLYQGQVVPSNITINDVAKANLPQLGDTIELDIVMGPRTDWFDQDSIEKLCNQSWLVTHESNRVGLRLLGKQPLIRKVTHELESEGTCIGALQIPPNGQPVLFMNDHPLTGGYPVIASVAKHHWDLVAQIPADCHIKFRKIAEFVEIEN
ncbi:urea amidolyase family protein [Acinetobacter sp.]|jgi:KipI family sensor histidine kinase inhibitor|uniref:5-oxoprolinase subunit B/C family protein n=1 Tax=Acinetobacter sp. TaxID=472 RepID=UPI002823B336|nr:urea amidolyase family protein [Acinetobacter sp.]MDR0237420.1 urea amidolyase family protein [Acinetobacter sp.]